MGVIKININTIVNYINERLAGEQLLYSQLLVFLDGTIDDINQALNSNFPAFSEFSEKDENYPDYNFFPDRYIRTVVVTGACAKFYICDEEGAAVAEQYQYEYKEKLFLMVRDYSHQVPEEYRAEHQGYMIDYTSKECNCNDLRNCTIDKPTGNLLTNSSGTDWKLNLIFENTPLSDNLRILNDTQKQCVILIIK